MARRRNRTGTTPLPAKPPATGKSTNISKVAAVGPNGKQERRDERKKPHGFEVGHILYASWGYEQTNIDFDHVTKVIGRHMVEVREVSQIAADTGNEPWMTDKVVPKLDAFAGESMRRRVNGRSICPHRHGANRISLGWTPGQLDRLRLTLPAADVSDQRQHEDRARLGSLLHYAPPINDESGEDSTPVAMAAE
ncbi:hypothetical protein [Sinorhizobium psoraleae]|uniref:Uncharacterized protein n=1 Tax=Sinorhizobium psoraleae TaxID=520838 RepID=A0ABT4KN17_9HYPH|nr:hypothetical protein [Sinorhizobium psoraleae]MCZ4093333.1 hypothetical protein [Sinorhizobium psoraleae]